MKKIKFLNWRMWIFLLALLLFVVISYVNSANQPEQYPPYVSHSPSPTGVKAFYTYLEEEYGDVSRWNNNPSFLPKNEEDHLLIMVEPSFIPPENDMAAYREFLQSGNTLLLVSESPVELFDVEVDVQPFPEESEGTVQAGETDYEAMLDSPIRFLEEDDSEVLLSDGSGIKALKQPVGDGTLIVSDSPDWLTNERILDNDHVPLVLTLVEEGWQDGPILFDDYIHGGEPTVATLYPQWFLLLMFQGGLLALLWLWFQGKRFGPVFEPREATVRFSDEGIQALAAWQLRLKDNKYRNSLHIQADYVKQLMQDRWGISYKGDWSEAAERLNRKWTGKSKSDIDTFLSGLTTVLSHRELTKKDYLRWSQKIDELRKEVEEK